MNETNPCIAMTNLLMRVLTRGTEAEVRMLVMPWIKPPRSLRKEGILELVDLINASRTVFMDSYSNVFGATGHDYRNFRLSFGRIVSMPEFPHLPRDQSPDKATLMAAGGVEIILQPVEHLPIPPVLGDDIGKPNDNAADIKLIDQDLLDEMKHMKEMYLL